MLSGKLYRASAPLAGWLGAGAISYGSGLIYEPLWFVVSGLFGILYSYMTARALAFQESNKGK